MAVVNTLATALSNADAKPVIFNNSRVTRMPQWQAVGSIEIVATDSIGSTFRMLRVPSNARVNEVLLSNEAQGGATTLDIGLYRVANDGGAVVDADFFASAQSIVAANTRLDVTLESGVIDIADLEKPLWELLGLGSDPMVEYDVVGTLVAAAAAAASLTLQVGYGQ